MPLDWRKGRCAVRAPFGRHPHLDPISPRPPVQPPHVSALASTARRPDAPKKSVGMQGRCFQGRRMDRRTSARHQRFSVGALLQAAPHRDAKRGESCRGIIDAILGSYNIVSESDLRAGVDRLVAYVQNLPTETIVDRLARLWILRTVVGGSGRRGKPGWKADYRSRELPRGTTRTPSEDRTIFSIQSSNGP